MAAGPEEPRRGRTGSWAAGPAGPGPRREPRGMRRFYGPVIGQAPLRGSSSVGCGAVHRTEPAPVRCGSRSSGPESHRMPGRPPGRRRPTPARGTDPKPPGSGADPGRAGQHRPWDVLASSGARRCVRAPARVRMAAPAASSGLSAIGRRPRRDRLLPMLLARCAQAVPAPQGEVPPSLVTRLASRFAPTRVSQVCLVVLATPQVATRLTHAERGCRWLHQRDRAAPPRGGSGSC